MTQSEIRKHLTAMRSDPKGETAVGDFIFSWVQLPPRRVGYYLHFVRILRASDRQRVAQFRTSNVKKIQNFLAANSR